MPSAHRSAPHVVCRINGDILAQVDAFELAVETPSPAAPRRRQQSPPTAEASPAAATEASTGLSGAVLGARRCATATPCMCHEALQMVRPYRDLYGSVLGPHARLHAAHMQAGKQQQRSACRASTRRPSGCPAGGHPWCPTCRHHAGVCCASHKETHGVYGGDTGLMRFVLHSITTWSKPASCAAAGTASWAARARRAQLQRRWRRQQLLLQQCTRSSSRRRPRPAAASAAASASRRGCHACHWALNSALQRFGLR